MKVKPKRAIVARTTFLLAVPGKTADDAAHTGKATDSGNAADSADPANAANSTDSARCSDSANSPSAPNTTSRNASTCDAASAADAAKSSRRAHSPAEHCLILDDWSLRLRGDFLRTRVHRGTGSASGGRPPRIRDSFASRSNFAADNCCRRIFRKHAV